MIVLDATAALAALLRDGPARRIAAQEQLHAPHLLDVEVASALRRRVANQQLDARDARAALIVLVHLGLTRYPMTALMERVWSLRDNLTAYDACYAALAEALGCALVTADARLARAPGITCAVTVVPA